MALLDNLKNLTATMSSTLNSWHDPENSTLIHQETSVIELKEQLSNNIKIIDENFDESTEKLLLNEMNAALTVTNQNLAHAPTHLRFFQPCVASSFNITKLLSQFGYINNRMDSIIRTSLSSRKEANQAHQDILKSATEISALQNKLEEQQEQITSFFDRYFDGDKEESLKSKATKIEDNYVKICSDDGYAEKIEDANNNIVKYHDSLFKGDSETVPLQNKIDDLIQSILEKQNKIQDFIIEYISGSSITKEDDDGEEITTVTESKKQLIDTLHTNFEQHITDEKEKIAIYTADFEKYEQGIKTEIESLLKGATNASLASSFETLKDKITLLKDSSEKSFKWALSLVVIAIVLPYIPFFSEKMFSASDVYLNLFKRALLTSPFIWWAFHQSRKANQYFRLEQEYAHKEVVSRSFEGYKSQVLELYKDSEGSNSMLQRLLSGSIDTITKNPADVLDKVKHTSSPVEEILKSTVGKGLGGK